MSTGERDGHPAGPIPTSIEASQGAAATRAGTLCDRPERLAELAEKYRLLETLRRGEPGRTEARRDAIRAIAERFPGAMREWDEVSLDELVRRRAEVERVLVALAGDGGVAVARALLAAPERAFIGYASELHERLRAALEVKRWLAGRAIGDELAREAERRFGIGSARLSELASPAGGRMTEAIHREVAALFGVTVEALKAELYPGSSGC